MKYLASLLCLLTLSVSAQVLNVSGTMYVGSITVVDTTAPSITADPSSLVRTNGQSATFTVTASGSGTLAYQWQLDSTNLASATTTSYAIGSVTNADAGSYRCVVTNAYGSVTSAVATLTVYDEYTPPNTNIVSDNFNRASLGAAWQVTEGGWTIVSNTLASWTNAPDGNTILYTNQAVSSANQWVLVTPQDSTVYYHIIHLRHTIGGASYYQVQFTDSDFYWRDQDNTLLGSAALGFTGATPIGLTLTGTSSNTVLRIFLNGSTNGPSSATVWSGSTTNVAITNTTAFVNTGTIVGLGAYYSAGTPPALSFDGFFAGGL